MDSLLKNELAELMDESGYSVKDQNGLFTVRKKAYSFQILTVISIILGIFLFYLSFTMALNYKILLLGFLFVGVPFIYERWKYPNKITIDEKEKRLKIQSGLAYVQNYRFADISSLEVDESVVTSDVSPFKDGYQDFMYDFRLKVGQTRLKLFNLMYRKASDTEIQQVVKILSEKLQLTKTA